MFHKFKKISKRNFAVVLAVLLLILAAGVYAQHRSRLNNPVVPSTNPLTDTQKSATPDSNASQQQSPSGAAQNVTPSGPPPLTPSGDFVSNHSPGDSTPTSEASTCNTSPGAICYIQFTKGSESKKLDARTTDARGAAIWYWDVKDAGLTQGSWTIMAVATLNGQTKTANDSQPLVVQ